MEDISQHKARLRTKQHELRSLLNEWNPLGVADAAPDEYDCLLGVIGQLYQGASAVEVGAYFREQLADHFGIDPDPHRPEALARRVFDWYWTDPL